MKKEFHPPIFSQEIKASVNLGELQRQTLEAISEGKNISPDTPIKITGKFELDGSGAHTIRHQKIDSEKVLDETPHLDPNLAKTSVPSRFHRVIMRFGRTLSPTAQRMPDLLLLLEPKKREMY